MTKAMYFLLKLSYGLMVLTAFVMVKATIGLTNICRYLTLLLGYLSIALSFWAVDEPLFRRTVLRNGLFVSGPIFLVLTWLSPLVIGTHPYKIMLITALDFLVMAYWAGHLDAQKRKKH